MADPEQLPLSTDEEIFGEVVALPVDFIPDRVTQAAEPMEYARHGRKVADIEALDGISYRTGLKQIETTATENEGVFEVKLKSRKNKVIKATGAALLLAAGVGAAIQFNRTHRKKSRR